MSKLNFTEKAYDLTRKAIISGNLKPRERLFDQSLANEFGFSRTPVREALRQLASEGLVEVRGKGFYVSDLDLNYMIKVYHMRAALEGYAARLACPKITDDHITAMWKCFKEQEKHYKEGIVPLVYTAGTQLHRVVLDNCGNELILESITKLIDQTQRFRALTHWTMPDVEELFAEHTNLIELVKTRSPQKVERAFRSHLLRVANKIERMKSSNKLWA
jgi:DNA-binding GntR family transcriptional regulator